MSLAAYGLFFPGIVHGRWRVPPYQLTGIIRRKKTQGETIKARHFTAMTQQPHTRSPNTGLSTIQKMVAETVEYYLQHGGPCVARAEVRAIAPTFSFMDDWPQAYRWAMERISQAEKAEQMDTEKREQQKLSNLMTSVMAAAQQQTLPPTTSTANKKPDLTDSHICHCLERLMAEIWLQGKPLFNQQNHWQAVFRILSDFEKFADDDFDGFDSWVVRVVPPQLRQLYRKQSVKNISQTLFNKKFEKWAYDPKLMKKREPYDRMERIARLFKEMLEGQD